jgi:hypothetical protein
MKEEQKYALQIPPFTIDEWKIKSLNTRGYFTQIPK